MNDAEYLKFYEDRVKKLGIRYHRSFKPLRKGKLKQIEKVPAFNEGKIAFSNDLKLSDNPYTETNSELALIWESGWKEAFEARKLFIEEIKIGKEKLERCHSCGKKNKTKDSAWLCSYCGFTNERDDKIEGIREEIIYPIGFWITAIIVFIGIWIYSKSMITALFFAGIAGILWPFFWPFVAVLIIGIIVIAYFIYKAS